MEEKSTERIRRSSRNKKKIKKSKKSKKSKKGKSGVTIIILLLLLPIFLAGGYYFYIINSPLKSKSSIVTITVKEADTLNSILNNLEASNNLKNKLVVKLNLKLTKKSTTLMPGVYEVDSKASIKELLNSLQGGDNANKISLAIPEGYTVEKIAEKVEEEGLTSKSEFLDAVKNYELPSYVKKNSKKTYDLEGYLYPDTYYLDKNTTPDIIISMMLSTFETRLKELEDSLGVNVSESDIEELIVKASLVEKEAVLDDERKLVAAVINNRLKINMKLGFCSTVNYVIGYDGRQTLTYDQIEIDSPYNTYKYAGLPVGPICNPGKESLEAAMKPEKTDYLYFVALKDQGGKQHFSTTLEEHERVSREQGY